MLKKLFPPEGNQKGFTLVELLVAIAITGIISLVIIGVTLQVITVNSADSNRMDAVKQVENALHWINRDAQMAWPSSILPGDNTTTSFPLFLKWTDYSDDPSEENMQYEVTYIINPDGVLERAQTVNAGAISYTYICGNINSTNSNYNFNGEVLTINLTSTVEGLRSATETRTLQVKPRTTH